MLAQNSENSLNEDPDESIHNSRTNNDRCLFIVSSIR